MEGGMGGGGLGFDADEEEAAGDLFEVVGEVFAAHAGEGGEVEGGGAEGFAGDGGDVVGHGGVVDGGRVAVPPVELEVAPPCRGDAAAAALDGLADLGAEDGREGAGGAFDFNGVGDDVGGGAAGDAADGDDGG